MGGRQAGSVWDGDVMFWVPGDGWWAARVRERGVKEAGKAGWQRWNPLGGCPLSAPPPSDHKLIVMPSTSSLSLHARVHLLGHELS